MNMRPVLTIQIYNHRIIMYIMQHFRIIIFIFSNMYVVCDNVTINHIRFKTKYTAVYHIIFESPLKYIVEK